MKIPNKSMIGNQQKIQAILEFELGGMVMQWLLTQGTSRLTTPLTISLLYFPEHKPEPV